jgi:pyrroloquinoline quinone biosynthesis protein B
LELRLENADVLFFDGTLYTDDEMIVAGLGQKTGKRMGHMSMSGEDGSLEAFRKFDRLRRIYLHINNTNPVWVKGSAERLHVEASGWEVAFDGMEISL